jgi:hypothetical protein
MQAAAEAITMVSIEVRFMTNSDLRADPGGRGVQGIVLKQFECRDSEFEPGCSSLVYVLCLFDELVTFSEMSSGKRVSNSVSFKKPRL